MVLVSHDLDEVLDVADDVSVLRDGRLVASVPRSGLDHDRLVELIVGRAAAVAATRATRNGTGTACLRADGLAGGALAAASFAVGRGARRALLLRQPVRARGQRRRAPASPYSGRRAGSALK